MKKVSVAIVGLGYWGPNWLRNFTMLESCEVRYACDKDAARVKKFQMQYPSVTCTESYEDILKDERVDAVVIATPTSTHFELAKKALESKKHVLVEKPMTSTAKEAEELTKIAKSNNVLLLVDHTFAYTEAVEKICEYAASKKLGDLLYFDSTRINLGLIQKDTSVFHDLAVHDLTILHEVAPLSGIKELYATGSAFYGKQTEIGHVHLSFTSGLLAHIHVSWLSPVKIRSTIIGGKNAMITYNDTEPSEKIRIYDKGVDHDDTKPDPFFPKYRSGDVLIPALAQKEALRTEAEHFLACINGKEKPRVSGEDGVLMMRVLDAIQESVTTGQAVRF